MKLFKKLACKVNNIGGNSIQKTKRLLKTLFHRPRQTLNLLKRVTERKNKSTELVLTVEKEIFGQKCPKKFQKHLTNLINKLLLTKIKKIFNNLVRALVIFIKAIKAFLQNPNFHFGFITGTFFVLLVSTNLPSAHAAEEIKTKSRTWSKYLTNLFSMKLWSQYLAKKRLSSREIGPIFLFGSGLLIGASTAGISNYFFNKYDNSDFEQSLFLLRNLYSALETDLLAMTANFQRAKDLHFKCWTDNNYSLKVLNMASKIILDYNPDLKIIVPPLVEFPNYDNFTLPKND